MSRWSSAFRAYRRKGIARGASAALRRLRRDGAIAGAYQYRTGTALAERISQLDRALPAEAGNLLDVGCNLGDITAHCAQRGLWAVGLDRSERLVSAARRRHRDVEGCAFATMDITPEALERLPTFDVVLLLSVHQHWVMTFGVDTASSMLRQLTAKSTSLLVYEGASRRSRYGDFDPGFVDNDEPSVTAFHERYLSSTVGDLVSEIQPLGKTPSIGDREPFRWAYALRRRPST